MRNLTVVRLALAGTLVFALACSEGGGGPTDTGFVVRLNIGLQTTSSHTIRKANLVFGGRVVATADVPGGAGQVRFEATVSDVSRGTKTIRVVIVDQASTPNFYIGTGAVMTQSVILDLAPVEKTLATGEALEFQITL